MRIFVVDDEAVIIEAVSMVLKREGYSVDSATDSKVALDRITRHPMGYDILICDQKMPHLSGSELIAHVRAAGFVGKVVMHSGNITDDDESIRKALGVDAIVTKPVAMTALVETIKRMAL